MGIFAGVAERPERALAAFALAQIVLWTLAPLLSHDAPPLDVIEMYAWGREHVVATFKHPNLPGLVLEGVRVLTGQVGWPAYVMSQLFIAATFYAVYALGRDLMDAPRALAGTLLLAGVFYFSWPTPEFNHNVAQMPFWAAAALFLWRATTRGGWRNWFLLGLVAGLGMWAKYSTIVLLMSAALWMLWDAKARRTFLTPGPYITFVVCALVAAPQALWILSSDLSPLKFAARRAATGTPMDVLEFLLGQVANHLPMIIMMACAGWFGKRAADAPPPPEKRALHFLLLMGLGPVLIAALVALIGGTGLKTAWATTMFNLSGLLVVALLSGKASAGRIRGTAMGAAVMLVLIPPLYFVNMRYSALVRDEAMRGNRPQAEISTTLEHAWAVETGAPLRVVAGDVWVAGLVGMEDRTPPSILIDGDYTLAPWLVPADVARDGALVVWLADDDSLPAPLVALSGERDVQTASFTFPVAPELAPMEIRYVVIPPGN